MEQIKVIPAAKNNNLFHMTQDFVNPYEKLCVQLVEKLNQKDADVHIVIREIGDDILLCGLFYYSNGGTILPFFIEKTSEVEQALREFFSDRLIFCISGEKSSADFISQIVQSLKKQDIKETRDFYFMEAHGNNAAIVREGYKFKPCPKSDSDFLYPLQIAYIKEEVVPEGVDINLPSERFAMDRLLKAGRIYVVTEDNGKIICKAQINGEVDSCILLGGVFTAEPYRRQGHAVFMMENLKNLAASKNKSCVLFVNCKNQAAVNLYQKTGFKETARYEIVYCV